MVVCSNSIKEYFKGIKTDVESCHKIASKARKQGFDPELTVDIPLAHNMAERVEGLMSTVAPQLVGTQMIKTIQEYEKVYTPTDWRVAFKIAEDVALEKFCKFESKKEAMEVGIRAGFSYITGGIVSAPLEGFIELKVKDRRDTGKYFSACYAGPIRGAGGTAAAVSVVLVDYIRTRLGYEKYDPSDDEIDRTITEIYNYHERAVNLQYLPSEDELRFILQNLPVDVSGDPTERIEVSRHKDLERIETNRIRGGMCLVIAEGIAQKAPKLWKRLLEWGDEFGIDWKFLKEFLELQKKIKSKSKVDTIKKLVPNHTFISDLVAGRPVLTHPMAVGGFRLRYGRTRISGFSAASIHPSTMQVLEKYIATGTQLKVERPGKAAAITPCDCIEPPIVKLDDGSVVILESEKLAKDVREKVTEIIYLGDILFNYGDFSENNHMLAPPGYCSEWWSEDVRKARTATSKNNQNTNHNTNPDSEFNKRLSKQLEDPFTLTMSINDYVKVSKVYGVALHPKFTCYWNGVGLDELCILLRWFQIVRISTGVEGVTKLVLPKNPEGKRVLELLGVPHKYVSKEFTVIENPYASAIVMQLALNDKNKLKNLLSNFGKLDATVLEVINVISEVTLKDTCGTFIGARMGRPEKAKQRKMTGSPQVLFPVGEEGGRLRCFQAAFEMGKVRADFPIYHCDTCKKDSVYGVCEVCGGKNNQKYYCKVCGAIEDKVCTKHNTTESHHTQDIDINHYFSAALKKLKCKTFPDLIKGVRGTSNKDHIPENIAKGILRAKNNLFVNKDGTTRFDMSELPLTHFKPGEIGTSIPRLRELGYMYDIKGVELLDVDQVLEIKPQDIIIPAATDALDEQGDEVLFRVGKFVDELLVNFYGLDSFYNFSKREDLVGHLVIGLAPHISAGIVGRIIGFSETQAFFAHPFFHAAMRRDADGDEACVILLMDGLLNFSRQYLPDKRGSKTMDSPLVLTTSIIPTEIDDQAHGIDVVWKYDLDFYSAALKYSMPKQVHVDQIKDKLGTIGQYEGLGYTHPVSNINMGIKCSAYKGLPSMIEKLDGQMLIARKVRAVDESDVARLVIEKHFIKDTKGNLRKFSMQQFRCVKCNDKYRRPPLVGYCINCGGRLIFTIAEGSVVKYLGHSLRLAEEYSVPQYLKQTLELLKRMVEDNFGKESEKQEGLGKFITEKEL